ncbi:MAG: hypothetical protein ACRDC4_05050 [Plesiomonas sp.]
MEELQQFVHSVNQRMALYEEEAVANKQAMHEMAKQVSELSAQFQ